MTFEFEIAEYNGKEYYILNEITDNDITYVFLSNVEDKNDTLIGKISKEDNETIIPLDEKESEIARHILAKYYMAPEKKNTD